jgi:phage repressor protein C with HTH and peptisase S24 domain
MTDQARHELENLIRERNIDYSALSRLLGRNPSYIQQFLKRGSPRKLDDEDLGVLAKFFGVNVEVLGGPPAGKVSRNPLIEIPLLDVQASAGHGALTEVEAYYSRFGFDECWLRKLTPSQPNSLSVIRVDGDSMEPTLSDGDEVMIDRSDNGLRLRDGIYVLRSDDMLVIKRLALGPKGRQISIVSDNRAYPSWHDVDRRSVHVVGRVLWFGRKVQ